MTVESCRSSFFGLRNIEDNCSFVDTEEIVDERICGENDLISVQQYSTEDALSEYEAADRLQGLLWM